MRIDEITAADWSLKLNEPGSVVENLDDINQCIQIILTTPKGSRPHDPLFGCDIWQFIDHPVNEALPRIISEAIDALLLWEPRIRLTGIVPRYDEAVAGKLALTVFWVLKEYDHDPQRVDVTL